MQNLGLFSQSAVDRMIDGNEYIEYSDYSGYKCGNREIESGKDG